MAKIEVSPIFLNDCTLTIGTDDYEAHVSAASLVPSAQIVTFRGLTPDGSHNFADITWVLNATLAQDLDTADSLQQYLMANQGTKKEVTLRPKSGGKGYKVTALIVPAQIGGEGRQVATASVTMPVDGQPSEVAAA